MRKLLATRPARPGAIKEGAWPTWRENLNRKDTESLQLGPDMSSGWRAFGVQQKPAARLLARCFRDESPHRSCLSHLMPRPLSREHSRHPLKSMSPNSPHVLTTAWKKRPYAECRVYIRSAEMFRAMARRWLLVLASPLFLPAIAQPQWSAQADAPAPTKSSSQATQWPGHLQVMQACGLSSPDAEVISLDGSISLNAPKLCGVPRCSRGTGAGSQGVGSQPKIRFKVLQDFG